jgi:hypothetical protein
MILDKDKGKIRSYRVEDSRNGWVDVSIEVSETKRPSWYIAYTGPDMRDASNWVTEHVIPNLRK